MTDDPDEFRMEQAIRRNDPRRAWDALERIEWQLMYGEYLAPKGLRHWPFINTVLLALILWRVW